MEQQQLFAETQLEVPGFFLRPDYVDAQEERVLLTHVDSGPWETDWRRRIQQYGLGYSSGGNKATWIRDLPD